MESPYPNGSLLPGVGVGVGAGVGSGGGVLSPEQHLSCPVFSTLLGGESIQLGGDVFLDQYRDVDASSEWLSSFVEECLSSAGNYCLPTIPTPASTLSATTTNNSPEESNHHDDQHPSSVLVPHRKTTHRNSGLPGKPRSQRKRRLPLPTSSSNDQFPRTHKNPYLISRPWPDHFNNNNNSNSATQFGFSDPPLLEQAYWLADSELIHPLNKSGEAVVAPDDKALVVEGKENHGNSSGSISGGGGVVGGGILEQQQQQPQQPARRCTHCQAQKTPQWRAGPMGPKTLCNACGVRYFKSGKLLPEYRPAKSPTFVSYKHSNSHKKVLQMRMAFHSSSSSPNSKSDSI